MGRPLFSLIIPVFNRAYCIERCLRSVEMRLEAGSFEVVLVDDGSKDNSVDIVKNFITKRAEYRLIILTNNMGVNTARNEAIAVAKGQWLIFLDSDDELCIDGAEMKSILTKLQDYELVSFRCKTSLGEVIGPNKNAPIALSYKDFLSGKKSFETLDLIKRDNNSEKYFENSINGFEGVGWARLLKVHKKLIVMPPVGRCYHSDANNQLMKVNFIKKSPNMARGYKIFLRENFRDLTLKYKVICFVKWFFYSVLSKFLSA
tara:strand:- start:2089 stop:2868 length:780 start_codon:yes stop_codon:yes gene_type:complete